MKINICANLIFFFISLILPYKIQANEFSKIDNFVEQLKIKMHPQNRVAISYIYDAITLNITKYGNLIRDTLTNELVNQSVKVVPRKDLIILLEDINAMNGDILKTLSSDILIIGCYYLKPSKKRIEIDIVLKSININTGEIIASYIYSSYVSSKYLPLLTDVVGNIRENKLEKLNKKSIYLNVSINKVCYKPNDKVFFEISTIPGIYLYIFNIAADGSIARIFPNDYFKQNKIVSEKFIFPPKELDDMTITMQSFPDIDPAYESFRIIASKVPLHTEEFEVPENKIIIGGKAQKLEDLLKVIGNKEDIVVKDIPYLVGNMCN